MKNGRLQILDTSWHVMHAWDLMNALKNDADFYLVHNTHRSWLSPRYTNLRPIPDNVTFVPTIEPENYDLAILHVDQQIANPILGKSQLARDLIETTVGMKRVVINHGGPVYPEFLCKEDMTKPEAEAECRRIIKEAVGDIPMIVNSHTAAGPTEWGWGHPIWHGMNPDEWFDRPKEPRVFTALSVGGTDEYYNRECMNAVGGMLEERYGQKLWWAGNNVQTDVSPTTYKEFLGRSLVYFDCSFRTPMNRARTEAMLSGSMIVQVEGAHDLDRPVEGGKLRDFMDIVPNDPEYIVEHLHDLLENRYAECIERGRKGREMAIATFNRERYRQDWLNFIRTL